MAAAPRESQVLLVLWGWDCCHPWQAPGLHVGPAMAGCCCTAWPGLPGQGEAMPEPGNGSPLPARVGNRAGRDRGPF